MEERLWREYERRASVLPLLQSYYARSRYLVRLYWLTYDLETLYFTH